ncbi:MAG: glycosyltransferase family 4 protein [Halobacteriovoraceae bacterium]|jgi:glycosyltransferase involved in cell wall biosynthesis|nr:glycosyltransferase family 4 protein [Halobacteriovoraceae bacterium]MBT5093330.1 glycosyltransferase family 4 protein [Halobacteriovoraceae bacterium]
MSTKSTAVFLNSPYLGGAERSMVLQTTQFPSGSEVLFFIPILKSDPDQAKDLTQYIRKLNGRAQVRYFNFPEVLYGVSRSSRIVGIFFLIFSLAKLVFGLRKCKLKNFDFVWANGNKVGFPLYLWSLIFFFRGNFVWHFRDYPEKKGLYGLIWKLYKLPRFFNLILVANSNSVADTLRALNPFKASIFTLYNPAGNMPHAPRVKSNNEGITLAMVSMVAPWKGVRFLLEWAHFFERELTELGVVGVYHFGGDIYKTSGEHAGHFLELRELEERLASTLWQFKGHVAPEEIYPNIDVLIHPSLRAEPFGRVITEAYSAGLPVISTALGGASELVAPNSDSRFEQGDSQDLFNKIKNLLENPQVKRDGIEFGRSKLLEIEPQIPATLAKIFNSN